MWRRRSNRSSCDCGRIGLLIETFLLTFLSPCATILSSNEPLAKLSFVVRQAHHERIKFNNFNPTPFTLSLSKGILGTFARGSN